MVRTEPPRRHSQTVSTHDDSGVQDGVIEQFPHETCLVLQRQIIIGGCCTLFLLAHNAWLLYHDPAPMNEPLRYFSLLRLLAAMPRPFLLHMMFKSIREGERTQPDGVRLAVHLKATMSRWNAVLNGRLAHVFHAWLVLVAMRVNGLWWCSISEADMPFADSLWFHWKLCFLDLIMQRLHAALCYLYYVRQDFPRGIRLRSLEQSTATRILVDETDPLITDRKECVVCLAYLAVGDHVRTLRCSHVFHIDCIDPWLTVRRSVCPVCNIDVMLPQDQTPVLPLEPG
jgi:hypothetical protein